MKVPETYVAAIAARVSPMIEVKPNGIVANCVIRDCKSSSVLNFSGTRLPPEAIRNMLSKKGWRLGRRLVCPSCSTKKEAPMENRQTVVSPPISFDARKASREAMQWLEESFDVVTGRYREGQSDKSIADETKLAVQAVVKLREDFFGPLKKPVELDAIESRITEVEKRIADVEQATIQKVRDLTTDLHKLQKDARAAYKKLGLEV